MDAPLIPREMSSLQKGLIYTVCGGTAIYFIVVVVMSFLNGQKYDHFGNYLAAIGLLLLLATTYFVYSWMPHDSVDDRVKYAIYAQVSTSSRCEIRHLWVFEHYNPIYSWFRAGPCDYSYGDRCSHDVFANDTLP